MKIIFTGGGTLGHVIPLLTLASTLKERDNNLEMLYVGQIGGVEEHYVKSNASDIKYFGIRAGKLRRYFDIRNFIDPMWLIVGFVQSLILILTHKPDLIFAKGGYVTVPVCLAGFILRVRIITHESDFTIGLANKINSFASSRILTSFPVPCDKQSNPKYIEVGLPISSKILNGSKERLLNISGLEDGKKIILFMGGTSGASYINELVWGNLGKFLPEFQIIHICGNGVIPEDIRHTKGYYAISRTTDQAEMGDIYAATDIIIARSGATTCFEASALNKPMIAIPLPLLQSRGDQIYNAQYFAKQGLMKILEQSANKDDVIDKIINIIRDGKFNLQNVIRSDSARRIADIIFE